MKTRLVAAGLAACTLLTAILFGGYATQPRGGVWDLAGAAVFSAITVLLILAATPLESQKENR